MSPSSSSVKCGSGVEEPGERSKKCRMLANSRKNSMRARDSPMQERRPSSRVQVVQVVRVGIILGSYLLNHRVLDALILFGT